MFDFTQSYYMYQDYENDMVLRDALRDCKTEKEKEEVLKEFRAMPFLLMLVMIASFIVALIFCGIISIFT